MPVLAPGLADALIGDPDPPVLLGLEEHLLDAHAVLLLDVGAVAELAAGAAQALGQLVAQRLELGQREHPRAPARADRPLEPLAGPGRAEQLGELVLQARDLIQERAPGGPLVGRGPREY